MWPEGRALLGRADQLIAAATDEYLAALDPEDIETLRTLALRVLASRADLPSADLAQPP